MKTKSKKKKIVLCVVLAVVIALLAILGVRIIKGSSWSYTEEQHLQRISKLVEKRYMGEKSEYTSYEVFPLYDQNEKMKYCIVEFEPYGFVWVKINDFALLKSLYTRYDESASQKWSRYDYIDTTKSLDSDENKKWETDESGERVYYDVSPYKAAGVKDEKRYLITIKQESYYTTIPAVKHGDKFLNLMDMKEFEYVEESKIFIYPYFFTGFPPKSFFDL